MRSTDLSTGDDDQANADLSSDELAVVAAYRQACRREPVTELDQFLAQCKELSPQLLAALIRTDLVARWRRQDPHPAENYLERYRAVAEDAELAVDVIYAEYLAREQAGQPPDFAEYRRRFPQHADVLAEQISLHAAIESDDDADEHDGAYAAVKASLQESTAGAASGTGYQILELIGRGGMGVVYKAWQPALDRFVALKMVRAIDASNEELLARFRSEARVVAALEHPHIVKLYEYGEQNGLPYFVMELVEGGSLADRLNGIPWQPRDAARLLVKLARAMQFAHEHRVVHRDLKPANVLIASATEPFEVKITDFGLARLYAEEVSSHTKSNAFFGTPSYMAPEQARGDFKRVGPASDIYALGAILYELLTGRPPFRGDTPMETLQLLLFSEPVSIHRLAPRISRDLATICDKCMRGEIERRYATAGELCEDLERFLAGRPIRARRVGAVERAWRWCRRNPPLAAALGTVAILLLSTAAVALWYSGQLAGELSKTQAANLAARERLWDAYLAEVTARHGSQQVGQRFAALDTVDRAAALLETIGGTPDRKLQLRNAVLSSVALTDLRPAVPIGRLPAGYYACGMSAAANSYAISTATGTIDLFRLSDGALEKVIPCGAMSYFEPIVAPNGRFVAAVSSGTTQVWRIDEPEPRLLWTAIGAEQFTFQPDGKWAAYSTATGMLLVNVLDGTELRMLGRGPAKSRFAFHPANGQVAVCGSETVQVIDVESGKIIAELPQGTRVYKRLAWHPSGQFLAIWAGDDIEVWNVKSASRMLALPHRGVPNQLVFTADGSLLASQSLWDSRLLVWDVGAGQRLLDMSEFDPIACDVSGAAIAFLSKADERIRLTKLAPGACRSLAQSLYPPLAWWYGASASPEGRMVAFSSEKGVELWDLVTTERLLAWPVGRCWAQFDRAGRLTLACEKGLFRLPCHREIVPAVNPPTARASMPQTTVVRLGPPRLVSEQLVPESLAANETGETLMFQTADGWEVIPSNATDGTAVHLQTRGDPRKGAVSNDNRYAATATWDQGGASIWDAHSGAHLVDLAMGKHAVAKFSPDSRWLAATPDGVTIWETARWQRVHQLGAYGTTPTGLGIAFSPDSRVLAVGQTNGRLRFADPRTGGDWAQLSPHDLRVATTIAFTPQQRYLVAASSDETSAAKVWNLVALRRALAARGLDLPADVLNIKPLPRGFEEHLEVHVEDAAQLGSRVLARE